MFQHAKLMLFLILGILAVIASYYTLMILAIVIVTFIAAKLILSISKAWNGDNT